MKPRLTENGIAPRRAMAAPAPPRDGERPAAVAVAPWLDAVGPSPIVLTPRNTRVTFSVRWLFGLVVQGNFADLRGVLYVPEGDPSAAAVTVEIEAASIRTGIGLRDRHLRGPLFLDVAHHPLVTFRGGSVMRWPAHVSVPGSLTIRGEMHTEELYCVAEPSAAAGPALLTLRAASTVRRRAYGIGTPRGLRRLDPLFAVIGDEVQITIAIEVPVRR